MKEITLTRGKVALVDDVDFEQLNQFKWRLNGDGYAVRWSDGGAKNRHLILMHREILGVPDGYETDHIDGNRVNNKKINLRVVTHRQNGQNRHDKTSCKYPGVTVRKDMGATPYHSRILINGKSKHLGYFSTEEEAFAAYKKAVNEIGEKTL